MVNKMIYYSERREVLSWQIRFRPKLLDFSNPGMRQRVIASESPVLDQILTPEVFGYV